MPELTYLRIKGAMADGDRFGPKRPDHPSLNMLCLACGERLVGGDYTTLVALGPGADPEARQRARTGGWYNGVAVEVHWACATGEDVEASAQEMP